MSDFQSPAPAHPLPEHADHVPEIAIRLRRLGRLAGVADCIPEDDHTAVGAIFTVLGMMSNAMERAAMQAPATIPVPAGMVRSDAEFWLSKRGQIIDALRAEGLTMVTTLNGVQLMRLGTIEAQAATSAPAVTHGSDMLEPLIYAAMMHNGKPKTVAEFERVAANVADMLQRRAADAHEKPVASIYISADGSREFDDWRVDLPPGNHQLFTAPRPAQPQPESLPHPGAPEAEEMIDKLLAEYNRPANMKNAARAGYMAARRLLQNARQPLPAVEDAEPIGWGGVIETCAELCDPHFIAQQDLDELKRYAGNWNSTYRFFPIYAPGAQLTEGPAVLAERDALKAAIVELNAAEFAYARYIRSDGLEKHRQNRERRIAAWQAARKLVGADGSNVPVHPIGGSNG